MIADTLKVGSFDLRGISNVLGELVTFAASMTPSPVGPSSGLEGIRSVKEFGAVGDDTHEDLEAFDAAYIDAVTGESGVFLRSFLRGAASSITSGGTIINDTSRTGGTAWTVNVYAGLRAAIVGGAGIGQVRTITANGTNSFTVSVAFIGADATSLYAIEPPATANRYAIKAVYVPPGVYRLSGPWVIRSVRNFRLFGAMGNTEGVFSAPNNNATPSVLRFHGTFTDGLDLQGVQASHFQDILIDGADTAEIDHLIHYHFTPGQALTRSTRNLFQNVSVEGRWKVAAWRMGSAAPADQTQQEDQCCYYRCTARGNYSIGSGDTTHFQFGFYFGTGVSGNPLIHNAYYIDVIGARYGVINAFTDVAIYGGCIQSNDVDFYVSNVSGYMHVDSIRSEGSRAFLIQQGGNYVFSEHAMFTNCSWHAEVLPARGVLVSGTSDVITWQSPGSFILENFRIINTPTPVPGPAGALGGYSFTKSGSVVTLHDTNAAFGAVNARIGWMVVVNSPTSQGNGGIFPVTASDGTSVSFTNADGVAEAGAGTYELRIWPRFRVDLGATMIDLRGAIVEHCPLEQFVIGSASQKVTATNWSQVDHDGNPVVGIPGPKIFSGSGLGGPAHSRTELALANLRTGAMRTRKVPDPTFAPQTILVGTPGSASATYRFVYRDANGNQTLASPAVTINNVPNTLSGVNYVQIGPQGGTVDQDMEATTVDILKGGQLLASVSMVQWYRSDAYDKGQVTYAYSLPTRNATADAVFGGALTHAGDLLGFYNTAPIAKQTLAGDTLPNLLTALRALGLIV